MSPMLFVIRADADTLAHAFGSAARRFGEGHRFHWRCVEALRCIRKELEPPHRSETEIRQTLAFYSATIIGLKAAGLIPFDDATLRLANYYAPPLE